ncbi:cytochrome P450 [Cladochytrium replicatum]|nr:cytochrome P450 [Cladochytrium replicatum]
MLKAFDNLDGTTLSLALAIVISIVVAIAIGTLFSKSEKIPDGAQLPPVVPYSIPVIGSAIEFGVDPIGFVLRNQKKYGDCFSYVMLGQTFTVALGPEGNNFVFNVPIASASAEKIYNTLMGPVFGSGVVYDVPNHVFMEQKRFVKDALSTTALKSYVDIIRDEFRMFVDRKWKGDIGTSDAYHDMTELTIMTASRCLQGEEIRAQMTERVAKLYTYLDQALIPINVYISWLPHPRYINRDRANAELTRIFSAIIDSRRQKGHPEGKFDVLKALMESEYKDGSKMTDAEIAHMLIAMLMAGQHTSSATMSWMLFHLAAYPELITDLIEEQATVLTGTPSTPISQLPPPNYASLRSMPLLDSLLKEVLRLYSPIHIVMRKVVKPLSFKSFHIPPNHSICAPITATARDTNRFGSQPEQFDPRRFVQGGGDTGAEWTFEEKPPSVAEKSAGNSFLPFGAGRHRCIGEAFAYVQIKTLVCELVREFEFVKVGEGVPKADYTQLIVVPVEGSLVRWIRRPDLNVTAQQLRDRKVAA